MYPRNYNPDSYLDPRDRDGVMSDERAAELIDDDDPANWPGNNPYGDEDRYPGPSNDPSVWVTKSGSRLRLVDMTPLHLARSLACCIEHDSVEHPRARALLAELTRRSQPPQTAPHEPACSLVGSTGIDS